MGIKINNRDLLTAYIGGKQIIGIYIRGQKVWPTTTTILSCYFNGYWIDEYPWTDDTPWTD